MEALSHLRAHVWRIIHTGCKGWQLDLRDWVLEIYQAIYWEKIIFPNMPENKNEETLVKVPCT